MLAPGAPIRLTYLGEGGPQTVLADSYQVSLASRFAAVTRLRVLDKAGHVIAGTQNLEIRLGQGLLWAESTPALIRVDRPYVKLIREANGKLPLLDALPKSEGAPSARAFEVRISHPVVDVVDRVGGGNWSRRLTSEGLLLAGATGSLESSFDVLLEGQPVKVSLDKSPDRTNVRLTFDKFRADPYLDHLASADLRQDLKDVRWRDANLSGDIEVSAPLGKPAALLAKLRVDAASASYLGYLEDAASHAEVTLTERGLEGVLSVRKGAAVGRFEGAVLWKPQLDISGSVSGTGVSLSAVGPALRKQVASLKTDGANVSGVIAYNKASGITFEGTAKSANVAYAGTGIQNVAARLRFGKTGSSVEVERGAWKGTAVHGFVALAANGALQGALSTQNFPLKSFAPKAQGAARIAAKIRGTANQPDIAWRAEGQAGGRLDQRLVSGAFQASGTYRNNSVTLDQSFAHSGSGTAILVGAANLKTKALVGRAEVFGLGLRELQPNLEGSTALEAAIKGTWDRPQASGLLEVYGFKGYGQSVPVAKASFTADPSKVDLWNVKADSGIGLVQGAGSYKVANGALEASLTGKSLQVSDFAPGGIAGLFDIPEFKLSGKANDLRASGTLTSASLVYEGYRLADVLAKVSLSGAQVKLDRAEGAVAGGKLSATGHYDWKAESGAADISGQALGLAPLLGRYVERSKLEGSVSADAKVVYKSKTLDISQIKGAVSGARFNGVDVGDGPIEMKTLDGVQSGFAEIGLLDRYLRVSDFKRNARSGDWSGSLEVFNYDLKNIAKAGSNSLQDLNPDVSNRIALLDGKLSALANLNQTGGKPVDLELKSLSASALTYGGKDFGEVTATGSKVGDVWQTPGLVWKKKDTYFKLSGRADANGEMAAEAELSKFNFTDLSIIEERMSGIAGTADVYLSAEGRTKEPRVHGSIRSDRVSVSGAAQTPIDFGLLLDSIDLIPSGKGDARGKIDLSGQFQYQGLTGDLAGTLPFRYDPFGVPNDRDLVATLQLKRRELSTLSDLIPSLDPKKTSGWFVGDVKVSGKVDDLRADGRVSLDAKSVFAKDVSTGINDLKAQIGFNDDSISLSANARSSKGGQFAANAGARFANVSNLFESLISGKEVDLLAAKLQGGLTLDQFAIQENNSKEGYAVDTKVGMKLDFSGTLARPTIKGIANFKTGQYTLGSSTGEPTESGEPRVNPKFDIDFSFEKSRVKASLAQLDVVGAGRVQGTLGRPEVTSELTLLGGLFRTPGAKVNLEPGGNLALLYQTNPRGIPEMRMDVDFQGTTTLTARADTGLLQRYNVQLDFSGNILQEGGLKIAASSSPPDLSQDAILARLGQTQILEAFSAQTRKSDAEQQLKTALTSYALPVALDPLTSKLAEGLGLDYLSLDYNTAGQTTTSIGKALNRFFTLQATRELLNNDPTRKLQYDFRLTYRNAARRGLLNRLVFSLGSNQDTPYRLSVEYGFRF